MINRLNKYIKLLLLAAAACNFTIQTPVVTFDQPFYAIAKQIQWKWPEMYGEDKVVVTFGGLHIEMAALGTPGDNSRHCRLLLASSTCCSHQVTAAALYIQQYRAYSNRGTGTEDEPLGFDE